MVEVGDNVFVAPVGGQKDNLVVITGPGGAGAVLNEGDYNTWTKEWINAPSEGIASYDEIDILIDDKNEKLSIVWDDKTGYDNRFAIYNISDFSAVYESPPSSDYMPNYPNMSYKAGFTLGMTHYNRGGVSQSIQTYLLLLRSDYYTLEVWRGGATALCSINVQTDYGQTCYCYTYGISVTGKYIVAIIGEASSPYINKIMLYKGSYVEP